MSPARRRRRCHICQPKDDSQEGEEDARDDRKSKEQLEAEKRAILAQRIQPLDISGFDAGKLTEKAKELNGLIYRLESEKYDLEKRFKEQQYDVSCSFNAINRHGMGCSSCECSLYGFPLGI